MKRLAALLCALLIASSIAASLLNVRSASANRGACEEAERTSGPAAAEPCWEQVHAEEREAGRVEAEQKAEEEPWYERCNELPASQIEACFYEHSGEKEPSGKERPPTAPAAPVNRYIETHYRAVRSLFVNCPKADSVGGDALICEFRFLKSGQIVKGHASILAEAGRLTHTAWRVTAFHAEWPLSTRQRRCRPPPRRLAPGGKSLTVRGVSCKEAQDRAWRAESIALTASNLHLPSHFAIGDPHTDTLGFVVTSYRCHGTTVVRPRSPHNEDPYGELTARCRTRFGDRFVYVFIIGN